MKNKTEVLIQKLGRIHKNLYIMSVSFEAIISAIKPIVADNVIREYESLINEIKAASDLFETKINSPIITASVDKDLAILYLEEYLNGLENLNDRARSAVKQLELIVKEAV